MTEQPEWRPMDFDGLVVESARGDRLLALPVSVLEILRSAAVIRFRRGGSMFSMRLDAFMDGRPGGQPIATEPDNSPQEQASSAPTVEYGAPALPVYGEHNPSPTPPPPAEGDPLDPANVPLRVYRGGRWHVVYVTGEQYERYTDQGRIQPTEGNDQ